MTRLILALTAAMLLALPPTATARPGLRQRVSRWIQDTRAVLRPVRGGSIESYIGHCRTLGTGDTFKLTESRSRSGTVRRLAVPRQVAEVVTSRRGLRRYLNHIGSNTVELVYNQHSSEYGHMLVRAGRQVYEFRNVKSAHAGAFSSKVSGWKGSVGMVYRVDPAKLPEIQQQLGVLVQATQSFNLPPFDSYGKPVRLRPVQGSAAGGQGVETFMIDMPGKGEYRASGAVRARRVTVDNKLHLETTSGLRVPVVAQGKDGSLSVDTMTCTSFPIQTLSRLVPVLGFGGLSSYAQRYAKSAVTNLVRGDTPAVPHLVTVYTGRRGRLDVRQQVNDIGKRSNAQQP